MRDFSRRGVPHHRNDMGGDFTNRPVSPATQGRSVTEQREGAGGGSGLPAQGEDNRALCPACPQALQCDVSVEEDNRQEWTFTLYGFDNSGKATREVICLCPHRLVPGEGRWQQTDRQTTRPLVS